MIQHATTPPAGRPHLAIEDEELGPRLREVRILTPDEAQRLKVVEELRRKVQGELGRLDPQMAARLEEALDDGEKLESLTNQWFNEGERLRLGYWPEYGPEFREIEEGTLLKEFVVATYRQDLQGFDVTVLFQEKIPPANRRSRLGTALKLPGKMRHLSGVQAVITLGYHDWRGLTDADRQRLMHHELEHLEVVDGALAARGHDFEDFASIVRIYGIRSESERMNMDGKVADAIEAAVAGQFELLEA